MKINPFHLAIQVRDIAESVAFYEQILGCPRGRSDVNWVDYNLYGHQLVIHLNPNIGRDGKVALYSRDVDAHNVPVPHFGVVLEMKDWHNLADRIKVAGIEFIIEPYVRFKGQAGEQATMFFLDPSGNALEFKAFENIEQQLFET